MSGKQTSGNKETTSKEKILKSIRKGLIQKLPQPFPHVEQTGQVYPPNEESLDILFATRFNEVQGKFVFTPTKEEIGRYIFQLAEERNWAKIYCPEDHLLTLLQPFLGNRITSRQEHAAIEVGISGCEALVARTGSIIFSSANQGGRMSTIFPPVHLVIAQFSDLVYDIEDGFKRVQEKRPEQFPSLVTLGTGPSRTADIEKTLVLGAHGAREVFLFLTESIH